jgi:hypothetical protein
MFEPVVEAELQPHDLARILKLNRVTVSMWLNGHCLPHRLHIEKVQKLIDAVNEAVEAGKLPLPDGTPRRDREQLISSALENYWTQ